MVSRTLSTCRVQATKSMSSEIRRKLPAELWVCVRRGGGGVGGSENESQSEKARGERGLE